MTFFVALRKELLEQWRSYRLLIAVVIFAVFGMLSPLFAKLTPEFIRLVPGGDQLVPLIPPPTAVDAVAQYVKNLTQFGVILALLLAMGAVVQEKEKGTAALVLAKPLPRWAFLGAKFAALALTFLAATAVAAAAAYYYTLLLFEALPLGGWLALNGLLLLFVLVYTALTLFFSTISKSQVVAAGLAFAAVVVLAVVGAIPHVGDYLPNHLANWGADLAVGGTSTAWPALLVSVAIVAAALLGAWFVFRRQEL